MNSSSPTPRAKLEGSVYVLMENYEGDLGCTVYTGLGRAYSRAENWILGYFEDRNMMVIPNIPSLASVEKHLLPQGKHKSMILYEDPQYTLMIRVCRIRDLN